MLNLQNLIDDGRCYQTVRELRWPEGVNCPHCNAEQITKQGKDSTQVHRQKYFCTGCQRYFDDLTGTVFAGHHQPLSTWLVCLYLMGLNVANRQIAQELGLNQNDVQAMTGQLREGVVARRPEPSLSGTVECDEVYVVAGHKGHPEAVKKKAVRGDADGSRARGGAGH